MERRSAKWYDPIFEKRFSKISRNYIGSRGFGYFLFDFLACVPVFLYEASNGFTKDFEEKEEQIESNVYIVFIFFKLFKLLMLSRISQSLSYVGDLLSDRFVTKKIKVENIMGYVRAAGSFSIMIHIFSCAWIYIGALDDQWMDDEEKLFEDKPSTYVNSIYFITTTMTSVGYGDISGKNEH